MNKHLSPELEDYYLVMQMLQTVDVGLVILNKNYSVDLWNGFMENHSGLNSDKVIGQSIFDLFHDLPQTWLERKIEAVFTLNTPVYSTWEQKPRLFEFKSYRPLSGHSELMYQNLTFMPLLDPNRQVQKVCLLIYDVTESATSKMQLEEVNKKLEKLSRTDRLTGLYNRGFWEVCLEQEFSRNLNNSQITTTSLLIFDIDHFKAVNDTYGHLAGDAVIKQIAQLLKDLSRATDFAGRYGGEEFVLLMPNTELTEAAQLAEQLRQLIAQTVIEHQGIKLQVTISLGLSEFNSEIGRPSCWIARSDQALYASKQNGRNQTNLWHPNLGTNNLP